MDNLKQCKKESNHDNNLHPFNLSSRDSLVHGGKSDITGVSETSIVVPVSPPLRELQNELVKIKKSNGVERRSNRDNEDSEMTNITWKPLLPRPPAPYIPSSRLIPITPPTNSFTPETPRSPPDSGTPMSVSMVQPDLMPMLLEAAAEAALRDKRQERMVKNRAAAYESRKRKREQAERLTAENEEMKERIINLEARIAELTKENERYKQLLIEKNKSDD
ncbi:13448_t:CDS:1 [Acaulospora colombiana]|uniref:13448_t:CDS:1 n=1 Tax=Acaulospora colombiana TaxID=27376 RepID=A0ACA9N0W1_9GLOM|nr:13448_t:CDS:1 [Acaulospora colombiana]